MGRSKARKNRRAAAKIAKAKLEALNPPKQVGLFVTKELETAIEHCRENVERIAKDHRARNRKFRDSEFDLEHDTYTCLHGFTEAAQLASRVEIQRVTELFDQPYFFPENGAVHSNAIRQGVLGDCYFLSALATVSNVPGLIEKICVAVRFLPGPFFCYLLNAGHPRRSRQLSISPALLLLPSSGGGET